MITRRGFLAGILATAAAPAIVKASNLMKLYVPSQELIPKTAIGGEYIAYAFGNGTTDKVFDIMTYIGTGQPATIVPNFGWKPDMLIVKRRDAPEDWLVFNKGKVSSLQEAEIYTKEFEWKKVAN